MMKTNKKYTMIVTEEDARYGREVQLDFFVDKPWEGLLSDIVFGDTIDELGQSGDGHDNEGLFYMLYANDTGKRIGSGIVDWDSIQEDIEEYERAKCVSRALDYIKRRFEISDDEAMNVLSSVRYLDKMDNGENMLCYHGLESLVDTEKDENKFVSVWNEYENMIACDSGDLEWAAIEKVYGKSVREI